MQFETSDRYFSIETHLADETLTAIPINQELNLRLFSARCRESQLQALANQDYVLISIQQDGSSLCFCVCDGVGSSYRGDFAARYLGTRLVQWLQKLTASDWLSTTLTDQLCIQLNIWACEAQEELLQSSFPPEVSGLVREVLEELRATYGSETVFFSGRIDTAPQPTLSELSRPVEMFLCWMGNITARLFMAADHSIVLGGDDQSVGGWSTRRGLRGDVSTWHSTLTSFDHLIVYTDGLNTIEQVLPELSDDALQDQVRQLLLLPGNDDMTALTFQWLYPRLEGKGPE